MARLIFSTGYGGRLAQRRLNESAANDSWTWFCSTANNVEPAGRILTDAPARVADSIIRIADDRTSRDRISPLTARQTLRKSTSRPITCHRRLPQHRRPARSNIGSRADTNHRKATAGATSSTHRPDASKPACRWTPPVKPTRQCAAAAAAWPEWSETPAVERARVMFRFRQLLDEYFEELAALVTREHGKTLAEARAEMQRGIEMVEFACGIPSLLMGQSVENLATSVDCETSSALAGRVRGHYAVQLSLDGAAVDVSGRHRLRQYVRAETVGKGAAVGDAVGRTAGRRRAARRG